MLFNCFKYKNACFEVFFTKLYSLLWPIFGSGISVRLRYAFQNVDVTSTFRLLKEFQASTSGDFERYSRRRLALTSTFCFERYALRSLIIFLQQLRLRNMDFTIFDVLQAFHEVRIFEHSIQICSKQN